MRKPACRWTPLVQRFALGGLDAPVTAPALPLGPGGFKPRLGLGLRALPQGRLLRVPIARSPETRCLARLRRPWSRRTSRRGKSVARSTYLLVPAGHGERKDIPVIRRPRVLRPGRGASSRQHTRLAVQALALIIGHGSSRLPPAALSPFSLTVERRLELPYWSTMSACSRAGNRRARAVPLHR